MKKYKFKFNNLTLILMLVGILIAIGCIIVNALRLISKINGDYTLTIYEYISFPLIFLLAIGFIVIIVFAFFNSYYKIDEDKVVLKFGIIKNIIDLKEVTEIKLLTKKNKLELIFKDESYFVIATNPDWFESFVDEIKQKQPKIAFVQISEEEITK
jgi:hypothetical protein